jgi:hypothetical protein
MKWHKPKKSNKYNYQLALPIQTPNMKNEMKASRYNDSIHPFDQILIILYSIKKPKPRRKIARLEESCFLFKYL